MSWEVGQLVSSGWQPLVQLAPAVHSQLITLRRRHGWSGLELAQHFLHPATLLLHDLAQKRAEWSHVCPCGRHLSVQLGRQHWPPLPGDAYLCLDFAPTDSLHLCLLLRIAGSDGVWSEQVLDLDSALQHPPSLRRWILTHGLSAQPAPLMHPESCEAGEGPSNGLHCVLGPTTCDAPEPEDAVVQSPTSVVPLVDFAQHRDAIPKLPQSPRNIAQVRSDLIERGVVLPPVEIPSGLESGRALVELNDCDGAEVSGEDLALLLAYVHQSHTRGTGGEAGLVIVLSASAGDDFRRLVDSAVGQLKDAVSRTIWLGGSDAGQEVKMDEPAELASELGTEEAEAETLLSPSLGGTREAHGPEWVAFRRNLDTLLRSCRFLGDSIVQLYKELKTSNPAALADESSCLLRDAAETFQQKLAIIETSEALQIYREEAPERLRALQEDFPQFLQIPRYQLAVDKAAGLYGEIGKVLSKAPEKVSERVLALEELASAAEFREEAETLLTWLGGVVEPRLAAVESESSVSLFRLRVQERQLEAFFTPTKERLGTAEALLLRAQSLVEPPPDSASALEPEAREALRALWNQLMEKVEAASGKLFAVRNHLADSLVAHHMLEKVYDWALHNAKWNSKIDHVLSYASDMSEKRDGSQLAETEKVSEMAASVRAQLDRFPACELAQLPIYAERLQDAKISGQVVSLSARCAEAQSSLESHRRRLEALGLGPPPLPPSPAATVYEEPRSARLRDDDQFFARRRSYAGRPGGGLWEVAEAYGTPRLDDNSDDGDEMSPATITTDLTDQVVSCMGDATLKKRLSARKTAPGAVQTSAHPLLPSTHSSSEIDRIRPGSARFAKCRKPFAKFMKRSMTADLKVAPPEDLAPPPPSQRFSVPSLPMRELRLASNGRVGSLQSLVSEDESLGSLASSSHKSSDAGGWEAPVSPPPEPLPLPARFRLGAPPPFATPDQRIIHNIISELIDSEFAYVYSLHYVIQHYIPELQREDLPQELRGQRGTIFGNLERIFRFHVEQFLPQLKARLRKDSEALCLEVGRVFIENRREFHLYALYNANKPKSEALMGTVGGVFFRTKQLVLADAMDLGSYLLKPVQRMGKYALLLAQLVKACPQDDQETADILRRAEEMVTFQLRHGNHLLACDLIKGCDLNLKEQGQLIRQDELTVITANDGPNFPHFGRKKSLRRVFLFEQLVLFTKPQRSGRDQSLSGKPGSVRDVAYFYKHSIKMVDVGLTEVVEGCALQFELWVRRRRSRIVIVLQAPTASVKAAWVADISRLLWRQAIQNRELQKKETSSMGIGAGVSCVDLERSADRIQDRAVTLRTAGEDDGRGKRPHSLISLSASSASSSASSHSSSSSAPSHGAPHALFRPPTLHEQDEFGDVDFALGEEPVAV